MAVVMSPIVRFFRFFRFYYSTTVVFYFLKNRNRKRKKTEKNCKIETIGQESENPEESENRNNRRIGSELWITTLVYYSPI